MEMNMKTGMYTYNDESHNFDFYIDLSAAMKLRFVNSVVDLLVDENHYNSIIRDIIFDYYTIKIFTTVNTEELDNSLNFLNDVEDFLLSTNIVEIVKTNAFPTLFDELNIAVDKSIAYRTGIYPSPLSDALASLLSTFEKKINEVDLNSMMGMAQKLAGMIGEFTPESVVNAYMNSDVHKENLKEIAEAKKGKSTKSGKNGKKNEVKIDEDLGEAVRAIVKETKAEKAKVVE